MRFWYVPRDINVFQGFWDCSKGNGVKHKQKQKKKIREVNENLDKGNLRVAEKKGDKWITHEWIKKSVILYFAIQKMETTKAGPLEFHDKINLKNNYLLCGGSFFSTKNSCFLVFGLYFFNLSLSLAFSPLVGFLA